MKEYLQKPIKKNDELEVDIIRTGSNGEGVAVHEGIVVFVPFAIVGERVLVHIINDKNSFLIAKIIKIIKPSKDRQNPPCPYFGKCGGCDLQHISKQKQSEIKTQIVGDTLKKYANNYAKVKNLINGAKEYR